MTSLAAELRRAGVQRLAEVRHVRVTATDIGPDLRALQQQGREQADRLVDGGADLVVLDAPPGTAATAAIALLLELEPVTAIGTAAAPGWADRVVAVRDLLRRARPHRFDVAALLEVLGDPVLARCTGLVEGLTDRRTPVLLGDSTTTVGAALLAREDRPYAAEWLLASAAPGDPAGRAGLVTLGIPALLDLELAGDAGRYALAVLREALGGGPQEAGDVA